MESSRDPSEVDAISNRSRTPFSYRPDIDAMRGLAVLAVLIFHLNEAWLPGGFTGVDIFFVISGYVVTGSLLNHASEPLGQRLGGFYLRRIRRLLPNLLLMIGVTSLMVALIVPPTETRGMFLTAVKALYGWSNNHLLASAKDYFGLDASLNPFLHTWTLGVEEQFYLIFPLLLAAIGLGTRRALPLLAAMIALSLSMSFWWTRQSPMAAFFLMPSRFWELACGGLLLLAQRRGLLPDRLRGGWLRLVGLLIIGAALMFTREDQGFPAPGALPAVVGTLLVVQAAADENGRFLPARWLERSLVACGLLSYSLYLWHWPLITLMRWTVGLVQPWQWLVAVVGSFLLAWLAFAALERPVRRHPLPWRVQVGLALAAIGANWAGIDALAYPQRGQLFLGSSRDPVPRQEKISEQVPIIAGTQITHENCAVGTETAYSPSSRADFDLCHKPGRDGAREIFLLGDSHAHHLLPMLDAVSERTGQRVSFTFKSSCLISPDLITTFDRQRYETCRQFAAGEMERSLERLQPGDIVLVSTWLNEQLGDIRSNGAPSDYMVYEGSRRLGPAAVRASYLESMRRYARDLKDRGIELILMVDVPELLRDPVVCESWASLHPVSERNTLCAPPAEVTAHMQETLRTTLGAIAEGLDNVHVFDPTSVLLEDGLVQHRRPDGTLLYSDSHHLSVSGSRALAEPFLELLKRSSLEENAELRQRPR